MANAPDLTAVIEAMASRYFDNDKIRMLSIGTTETDHALAASTETLTLTGRDWTNYSDPILLQQIMSAQMSYARDCARRIVGRDRYVLVAPKPSSKQDAVLGLDKADANAQYILLALAKQQFDDFLATNSRWLEDLALI